MDYKYKTNKEKDMKKGLITFISLFFITCCAYAESKIPIKILRIVDGDTIEAQINRNKFSVRLVGIDCYETCRIHRAYRQAYENNLSIDEVIKKEMNQNISCKNCMSKTRITRFIWTFMG